MGNIIRILVFVLVAQLVTQAMAMDLSSTASCRSSLGIHNSWSPLYLSRIVDYIITHLSRA